ncbi:hypothetical protein ACQ4PT_047880 [Festuca glaucescens]
MEGDHPTAGDRCSRRHLYPAAAPAPSGLGDRMIRLTCHRGRLCTPRKPRVRFEPQYGRRKSTPLAGDDALLHTVWDVLSHLNTRRVHAPYRCTRLGDPPLAHEHGIGDSPLAPDHGIRNIILELSNLMQSLSMDSQDSSDAELDDHSGSDSSDVGHGTQDDNIGNFVIEDAEGTFELPMWIYKKLHTYQREGIQWFWSLHCEGVGGILGDDMGLGKTMQVSAFLAGLLHSGLIQRALIVCPKTILAQWKTELSCVGLKGKIRKFIGSNKNKRNSKLEFVFKEGGVMLTTYDMV